MFNFPKNVRASYRFEAVDIRDVVIVGRLRYEFDGDNEGWTIGEDDDKVEVGEWLEAFDGKDIELSIKMRNHNERGAKMIRREVVNAN